MPSTASKITLALSSLASGGIIYFVHYSQVEDRRQLHKGIEIEEERRAKQKQINIERRKEQEELTKAYRNIQTEDKK